MTKQNDGGPAFPRPAVNIGDDDVRDWWFMQDGMSLRDWFAGMAMQGILVHVGVVEVTPVIGADAYMVADAMLAAREKAQDES